MVLASCVLLVLHWAGSSSDGTVHVGKPATAALTTAKQPLTVQTKYFITQLPPGFTVRRETDTPNDATLLQLVISNGHQQFAVTIGDLPTGGLSALGDYNLRVSHPSDYEPYRPAGLPIDSTAFRALTGEMGFTDFWPHGSRYAEIALTSDGAASMPELFGTFEQASHNWQWQ